jgi:hypothetical protein
MRLVVRLWRNDIGERERRELYVLYTPFWREYYEKLPIHYHYIGHSAKI